jgi:electron transport complex protein RnfD
MYPTQLHSYLLWRSSVKPDPQNLASRRYTATVSLLPATMVGIFVFGWWAGWIVFLSIISAFMTDLLAHRFIYKDSPGTRDGTWMLTGLLLGLMMPPNVPWILPVLGASLAVFLGKHYLSVDGMPLLQPAAVGLLLLHLIGLAVPAMRGVENGQPHWPVLARGIVPTKTDPRSTTEAVGNLWKDFFGGDVRKSIPPADYRAATFNGQTPVLNPNDPPDKRIAAEATHRARPLDLVKTAPTQVVGRETGALPNATERYDWLDMMLGYVPATIGGSSGLALVLGIMLLLFTGAASPTVPLFAMGTMFGFLHFLSWMYGNSPNAPIIAANIPVHLLTGSTLLGIFYLAADPTTAPRSFLGKVYAGVAVGLIEVLLRMYTPLVEGIFLSVIIVQASSFVIDQWLAPPVEDTRTSGASLSPTSLGRL